MKPEELKEIQENMKENVINIINNDDAFVLSIETAEWHKGVVEYTVKIREQQ